LPGSPQHGVAFRLEGCDLREDEFEPIEHAQDLGVTGPKAGEDAGLHGAWSSATSGYVRQGGGKSWWA
jgi:hypothetical protein